MDLVRLLVWLVLCVVLVTSQRTRPVVVLGVVVVLRVVVPSTGGGVLLGDWEGNRALHPATVLLLVQACLGLRGRGALLGAELRRHTWWWTSAGVAAFLLVVEAVTGSGPTSLLGLTNAVLSPIVFFLLLRVHDREHPHTTATVIRVFVWAMLAVAGLVIVQAALRSGLPWVFRDPYFGPVPGGQFRPKGTFDSPLDLGFAAAVAIPLTAFLPRRHLRVVVSVVLLVAIVLSASRVPTVVGLAGTAWVLARSVRTFVAAVTAAAVAVVSLVVVASTSLLDGLLERWTGSDGSSTSARNQASQYIVDHIGDHLLAGGGWGAAWQLKGTVLQTTLENSYAILAFDLGLVPVALLLLVQLGPILERGVTIDARLAAGAAIVLGFAYSGLATMSAASTVLWLALAACRSAPEAFEDAPSRRPQEHTAVRERGEVDALRL